MNVACGNEVYDISKIADVYIRKATTDELVEIESAKNGSIISIKYPKNMQDILDKYNLEIGKRLPEPIISKYDLPVYNRDDELSKWCFNRNGNHKFSLD